MTPDPDRLLDDLEQAVAKAEEAVVQTIATPRPGVVMVPHSATWMIATLVTLVFILGTVLSIVAFDQNDQIAEFQASSDCRTQLAVDVGDAQGQMLKEIGFLIDSLARQDDVGQAAHLTALRLAAEAIDEAQAARDNFAESCA